MDEKFLEMAEEATSIEIREGIGRARARAPMPPGFDGSCECGENIPTARVSLGYYRCITCQTLLEKKGRRYI